MKVAGQIREYLRQLHPEQRGMIKTSLRNLADGKGGDVLALTDELEGFYRLRAGRFRIIFRYLPDGEISCEYLNTRDTVYERFATLREIIERR
ncbi:MAG TPA: cytotoxic translational repressor of toxin-antitoxin stability system [Opitutales bacterium]|nr:cytotoxic translational repressor of toxin-antitoxin stability system [Opitutales bacterium]